MPTEDEIRSRAYRLFLESLERPERQREEYLRTRGASDAETQIALQMLCDSLEASDSGIGSVVDTQSFLRDRSNTRVGDWNIGEYIGSGGNGTVYKAWRAVGAAREEAAVKFLRDMGEQRLRRFHRERQALADLNHEGICKFIDGGTTDDGVAYLVMEYVAGVSITAWCDGRRKTITERLQLFLKLCRAVEHAHDRRIVHRETVEGQRHGRPGTAAPASGSARPYFRVHERARTTLSRSKS